jgi:hypothetical protein
VTVLSSPGKCLQQSCLYFETVSFHILFKYITRRCDIVGSALTHASPCLDYSRCNCLLSFRRSYVSSDPCMYTICQ